MRRRSFELPVEALTALDQARREGQIKTQELQNQRNTRSKAIGMAKAKGEDVQQAVAEVEAINQALAEAERELEKNQEAFDRLVQTLPNLLSDEVPDGASEDDNKVVRQIGQLPHFTFPVLDHTALGERLGQMDFAAASRLSGSRFVVLHSGIARLHRVLAQFMLEVHTREHGYREYYIPYLVGTHCMFGTGQFPNLVEDQFNLKDPSDLWLIPTAEVSLTNLVRDQILDARELPMKLTAHSPCFRREAGSYGRDTRGMIRQHQFDKVELVQIVEPSQGEAALEEMTSHAEAILQKLELPYRSS